ncbi:MAG: carbohydrate ABC transporter permease, partial [Candidatus Gallimonas sp.]
EVFTNAFGKLSSGFTFWRALFNNLLYSVVPVSVGVITSASAAFSFAKLDWKGRNVVFYFLLAAIMIPGPSIMVSQFVMYDNLGWRTNGLVLIVPGMFGSIMTAFFIRQFLFGLPTSIIEAAQIDGAGYPRVFVGFILPLALPAIMAQAVLSFMGCWNNYLGSFIMIPPQSEWINLPHAIVLMEKSYEGNYAVMIAASVICVLPVMVLFACFQKLIIGSLMLTGSKE